MTTSMIDAVWLHWPETRALAHALPSLRFVGGCVRDTVLGREVRDIDAATPLTPDQVILRLRGAGLKAIPTGIAHGTVTARVGARHFEVTTLRRDVTTDGRHATVAFTEDWQQDAARRDFTMNAMYCDPNGRLYDYFGGVEDAGAGRVRFIGEAAARVREDALRILRFFRFYAHYGLAPPDAQALEVCGALASLIARLSGERIAQEMLRLLVAERAAETVRLMQRQGVLPQVIPAVVRTESLGRLPEMLRKARHTPDPLIALALLLRSAGDATALAARVALHWKLSRAQARTLADLSRDYATDYGDEAACRRQIRAGGAGLFRDRALVRLAEGAEESAALLAITLSETWQPPVFPVTGDDLKAHGLMPGRELGAALKTLEATWEDSGYTLAKKELMAKL